MKIQRKKIEPGYKPKSKNHSGEGNQIYRQSMEPQPLGKQSNRRPPETVKPKSVDNTLAAKKQPKNTRKKATQLVGHAEENCDYKVGGSAAENLERPFGEEEKRKERGE
jgi:hypothetical protein